MAGGCPTTASRSGGRLVVGPDVGVVEQDFRRGPDVRGERGGRCVDIAGEDGFEDGARLPRGTTSSPPRGRRRTPPGTLERTNERAAGALRDHKVHPRYLHHTSWQVDDVDEIGRGATDMLAKDPNRHVWGLGRHFVGSNYFWYLRDPAGNFSEYYSDIDCIVDDQLWTPGVWEGDAGLYKWGPPPPPSFLAPEDLAGLMSGAHGSE